MLQTIDQAIMEDTYETVDGKWWIFSGGVPVRPLSDMEAADVIWGDDTAEVSTAEAIRNFNRALQVGFAVMAEMRAGEGGSSMIKPTRH